MDLKKSIGYIQDIRDSIQSIFEFIGNMPMSELVRDDKTLSAIIRKFEVIGEAAKRIPDPIKDRFPEIPWTLMARTRDRLIHYYADIDVTILWDTIKDQLPLLEQQLNKILDQELK